MGPIYPPLTGPSGELFFQTPRRRRCDPRRAAPEGSPRRARDRCHARRQRQHGAAHRARRADRSDTKTFTTRTPSGVSRPAQRPQFLAPGRMHTGHAPWHAAHAACWSECRYHPSTTPPARWRAVSRPPAIILQPSSPACQSFEEARCFGRSKLHRSLVPPTGLSNVRRKANDTPFS